MKKILLIGKNSTLCKAYVTKSKIKNFDVFSHNQINTINYSKYSHLINFSFNPKLLKTAYKKKFDIDIHLSKKAKKNNLFYIFFSTRYVYSKSNVFPVLETFGGLKPENNYGKNKLIIENHLRSALDNRLLILRLGTFLFYKLNPNGKLFSEKLLYTLYNNKTIFFNIKKNIFKDFITDSYFVKSLDILIKKKITGTYNLSSGIPICCEEIANNVINGFGKGKIIFKNIKSDSYSFLMSNQKLRYKTGITTTKKNILDYCVRMGKKLSNVAQKKRT